MPWLYLFTSLPGALKTRNKWNQVLFFGVYDKVPFDSASLIQI